MGCIQNKACGQNTHGKVTSFKLVEKPKASFTPLYTLLMYSPGAWEFFTPASLYSIGTPNDHPLHIHGCVTLLLAHL